MKRLIKPDEKVEYVVRQCISNLSDDDLRNRIAAAIPSIEQEASVFENAVTQVDLHLIKKHDFVNGNVTKNEMLSLYKDKLAKGGQPPRAIYDRILGRPKNGICPLCGVGPVANLDHHMIKSEYPSLAIVPSNLIPACVTCNIAKRDYRFKCKETQTFHPYFDDFSDGRWLSANIIHTTGPSLVFSVQRPGTWSELKFIRAKSHFDCFKLDKLYAFCAINEIFSIRIYLDNLFKKAGKSGLQEHLSEMEECQLKNDLNSWRAATYTALRADNWFCEGGYSQFSCD